MGFQADDWPQLLNQLEQQAEQIRAGGGSRAAQRQHEKGRLTARERIQRLLDPDGEFLELGLWAAWGMYESWGGAPAAGVVCGVGPIEGRAHMIIANDATVKAGAFFPLTAKKVLRAQRIAYQNRLPLIYLVDSAGIFLPLQEDVFPDEDDFGRIFRNNAVLSAAGVPQLAAIMGSCVAGGGYLPVLCDQILMTEGSGLYLAGPALVQSAIGQRTTSEELGGAAMHAQISGTIDRRFRDDESCLAHLRRLAAMNGPADSFHPPRPFLREEPRPAARAPEDVYELFPLDPRQEYDVRDVIATLVDEGTWQEYRPEYGGTLVCGTARLGGFAVGVVANQHQRVRPAEGPLQFGSVIYVDSAEKAARFVLACNQQWLPLIFLQDVNGFMVGRDSERAGIIKAGAKLVNAISNSRVPKLTVILGGSFGAGNYALCGKAFDPRFLFAWPTARIAVMGAEQATETLLQITLRSLQRQGKPPQEEQLEQLRRQVMESYQQQMDPRWAAARLWVDDLIPPHHTREKLIRCLELCTRWPTQEPWRLGVFQV